MEETIAIALVSADKCAGDRTLVQSGGDSLCKVRGDRPVFVRYHRLYHSDIAITLNRFGSFRSSIIVNAEFELMICS